MKKNFLIYNVGLEHVKVSLIQMNGDGFLKILVIMEIMSLYFLINENQLNLIIKLNRVKK